MPIRRSHAALLLMSAALAPLAQAQAAPACKAGGEPLTLGTVAEVAPGAARSFTVSLRAGDGVIVDLDRLLAAADGDGDDDHDHEDGESGGSAAAVSRSLALCNAGGELLAPLAGEVFEKGGSVTKTDEGERLRFVAQSSGDYRITVAAGDAPRELLVRRRPGGTSNVPIVAARLDGELSGTTSSSAPAVLAFTGPAGQWVELKSTSEKDTVLRLAAPDRAGDYSVIAENDDSDGLNPVIRRKLPVAGTYYVQVDSLSDEPGGFTFSAKRIAAPKPPPPPAALRSGATVTGKLADGDAVAVYALPVAAGRSYRLELTAAYDGVVAIGVPNPVEPEDGNSGADAGFTEIKSQDSGTTGTERLNFTARTSGQLLVRVKSFGIGETDGAYTLKASDLGG